MDENKDTINDDNFTEIKDEADQTSKAERYQDAARNVHRQNGMFKRILNAMDEWINSTVPCVLNRIVDDLTGIFRIGILLHVLTYFFPELPKRVPTIYAVFDGGMQLVECIIRTTISGVYALFTGGFFEWLSGSSEEFHQLVEQFINWMASL